MSRRPFPPVIRRRDGGRGRPQRQSYDGRLQGIANGVAIGWAWDTRDPERRLEVAIEAEGEVVAEGVADLPREELVKERIGDGSHGFEIPLPDALAELPYARIVALGGPERQLLTKSASFWQNAKPDSPWEAVKFISGREGDPAADAEVPVEVPPIPQPASRRAIVGREGWLFDAAELGPVEEPEPAELERVAGVLSAAASACAELGIAYVVACLPEKVQAVAAGAPFRSPGERPWLTGVRARLRDRDDCDLLDLLPVLEDARRHGPTFHRSDPDWNDRGAFFVARALVKEAAKYDPTLSPLALPMLDLRQVTDYRGELADAPRAAVEDNEEAPAEDGFGGEEAVAIDPAGLRAERQPVERHLVGAGVHVRLWSIEGRTAPRLTVVGGAACLPLLPWLAESAGRTTFFWSALPPMEPVELELPSVVLHLIRYRDLAGLPEAVS